MFENQGSSQQQLRISRCHLHIIKAIMRWINGKLECESEDRKSFVSMIIHFYIGVQAQPTVFRALGIMNTILGLLKTEHWSHPCKANHIDDLCRQFPKKLTPRCDERIKELKSDLTEVDRRNFKIIRSTDHVQVQIR